MIVIAARIEVNPAHADAYIEALSKGIEASRQEKGCYLYAVARDVQQANVIWITEQWESEQILYDHLATDHIKELLESTADLEVVDMDVRKYEVSSVGALEIPE